MKPMEMLTQFGATLQDHSNKFVIGSHSLFDVGIADDVFDFNSEFCENIREFCRREYLIEIDKILYLITVDADELTEMDSAKSNSSSFIYLLRQGDGEEAKYIALVFFGEKIERVPR